MLATQGKAVMTDASTKRRHHTHSFYSCNKFLGASPRHWPHSLLAALGHLSSSPAGKTDCVSMVCRVNATEVEGWGVISHLIGFRHHCTLAYLKCQPLHLNTDVSTNNCRGFQSKLLTWDKGTVHLKAKQGSHTIQCAPSTSACWLHMWAQLPTSPNPGSCLVQTGSQELNWKLIGTLHLPTDPQSVGPGDHKEK